jgi:hypothetical protein
MEQMEIAWLSTIICPGCKSPCIMVACRGHSSSFSNHCFHDLHNIPEENINVQHINIKTIQEIKNDFQRRMNKVKSHVEAIVRRFLTIVSICSIIHLIRHKFL